LKKTDYKSGEQN